MSTADARQKMKLCCDKVKASHDFSKLFTVTSHFRPLQLTLNQKLVREFWTRYLQFQALSSPECC